MKITRVDVAPLTYKLKHPFVYSGVRLVQLDYAIVRVSTEAGVVGYGECPAYWEPRGETQASTIAAGQQAAGVIAGQQYQQPEQWGKVLATIIPTAYAAACGIDVALHDALGQEESKPVYAYYGPAKSVPVEAAIPMVDLAQANALVATAVDQGITVFKVKVGMDVDREHELLQAVRAVIGPERTLFVDANQGWKTVDAAVQALTTFADANLAWVEQPLPANCTPADFRTLHERTGMQIMLDESTYTAEDAAAAATAGAAQLFNIKLAKSRGVWGAHELANAATAHNAGYMLGSMIEGALGTYAGVHFAATHAVRTTALNAFTFIDDPKAFGPAVQGGSMHAPDAPGLGYGSAELFAACFKR
ncbi:MAG: enolase C-terminal domain-like protein [bacterium]|nr:enolase C-terminal domain-like protein [bacterium]